MTVNCPLGALHRKINKPYNILYTNFPDMPNDQIFTHLFTQQLTMSLFTLDGCLYCLYLHGDS